MKTFDALIVGAGPAGLTAGYMLAKAGRSVLIVEQDPAYVGGISRTAEYKGYLFDIGGHRFFSKSKEVTDLWNEILPEDFIERPRLSRIFYRGRFYAYPLKPLETLRKLGPAQSLACLVSYAAARLFPIKEPKSMRQWGRNQFGERLFSIFFRAYTEKVWGTSCEEISATWASQRIKRFDLGAALAGALRRALRSSKIGPNKKGAAVKTLSDSFRYPRRGPGMMWEACAAKIKERGGEIVMDRKLKSLIHDAKRNHWIIEVASGAGMVETYAAEHVVSSAPVRELVAALRPTAITLLHARELKYRDFLTVVLIGEHPVDLPDNWIYIHDPQVKVGRVQNFRAWSPDMMADATSACLGLEYFCFEGDGLWASSDEELIARAKREIGEIGLMNPADIRDACVVRQKNAYPVYDESYADHIAEIRREIALTCPNLHLVGRNGMHKYNNQDHAMMTGMLTAANIIAGKMLHDVWQVNEDAEYAEADTAGAKEALKSLRLVPKKVA